uniref:Uncharacterized protein n=1 Tax=Corethron hystrix TaxID=216773 RepID=A0A7S1BF71_9STRA|mmetsp:Transcript_25392/g.58602  ORF Transcript_25392/g.58602 Transcript_25392/m.58602 type:complete len:118 (+) Transcript_25392:136-489(+)
MVRANALENKRLELLKSEWGKEALSQYVANLEHLERYDEFGDAARVRSSVSRRFLDDDTSTYVPPIPNTVVTLSRGPIRGPGGPCRGPIRGLRGGRPTDWGGERGGGAEDPGMLRPP